MPIVKMFFLVVVLAVILRSIVNAWSRRGRTEGQSADPSLKEGRSMAIGGVLFIANALLMLAVSWAISARIVPQEQTPLLFIAFGIASLLICIIVLKFALPASLGRACVLSLLFEGSIAAVIFGMMYGLGFLLSGLPKH